MTNFLRKLFKFLLLVVVILAAVITLIVVQQLRGTKKESSLEKIQREKGMPVRVVQPHRRTFTDYLYADGEVWADTRAVVRSRLNEEVKRVHAETGDVVEKGELLVEFRTKDLKVTVNARKTAAEEAERNYERFKALYEDGHVTKQALEQRRTAMENARAALRNAKSRLGFAAVHAPAAGIVETRDVEPGEFKAAGKLLLTIVDLRTVDIRADVAGSELSRAKEGAQVQFRLADSRQWHDASIARLSPSTSNPNRFFDVYMDVSNQRIDGQWLLRPGMYVEVRVPRKTVSDAVAVPENVVRQRGQEYYAFVVYRKKVEVPAEISRKRTGKPDKISAQIPWALKRYLRKYTGGKNTGEKERKMKTVKIHEAKRVPVQPGMREGRFIQLVKQTFTDAEGVVVNPVDDLETGQKVSIQTRQGTDR